MNIHSTMFHFIHTKMALKLFYSSLFPLQRNSPKLNLFSNLIHYLHSPKRLSFKLNSIESFCLKKKLNKSKLLFFKFFKSL